MWQKAIICQAGGRLETRRAPREPDCHFLVVKPEELPYI
jgi:hypothetical protein